MVLSGKWAEGWVLHINVMNIVEISMGFIKLSLCLKQLCSSYSVGKIIKIITFIFKKLQESNSDKYWFYTKSSIVLKYSQLYLLFLNEKKNGQGLSLSFLFFKVSPQRKHCHFSLMSNSIHLVLGQKPHNLFFSF